MNASFTNLARNLRKNSPDAENKLWYFLRAKRFEDLRFRRQKPIGRYIVDFICNSKKIIIELDGGQHAEKENIEKDKIRSEYLKKRGFKVIRFWDNEIFENCEQVLDVIFQHCHKK